MKQKNLFLFILALLLSAQIFAQRRSTNVRGYYRKNGTYVSPHTRHYNAGSGSSSRTSGSGSNSGSSATPVKPLYFPAKKPTAAPGYNHAKHSEDQVVPTTLSLDTCNNPGNADSPEKGAVIYVSVLRYNGKAIDICPIPRDIFGEWDFKQVLHSFDKSLITAEHALDLVGNYDWTITSGKVRMNYTYAASDKIFPEYLTRTTEAIYLK